MDNLLFNTYVPKNFCREFVEIKKSSQQLGMYMALVLGFKPLMDDWIAWEKLSEFRKICRKYKIYLREDVLFEYINKDDIPLDVIGRDSLTTTSAYGLPLETNACTDVHIFLSTKKSALKMGMWYPVITKDRVIFQPRADSLRYGLILGYPDCCIKFFKKFNEWTKYSYLYEAHRNTRGQPMFYCNPLLKDTSYSYIYHMPCSYNCKKTARLVNDLRAEILKKEPGFVKFIDKYLKMPFLVFYERKFYCFDGGFKKGILRYKKVYFCSPDASKDAYGEELRMADSLKLQGRTVVLYRNNRILKLLDIPLTKFAPEYPFLIKFN